MCPQMLPKLATIDECLAARKLMVTDDVSFHMMKNFKNRIVKKCMEF